ncbi:MAG: chemotaxis response regulator protein-glutamate methylesterase [Dorea sp.]|jgi:two-component system chemotaxis response regulator CheB|nr:chemotaxis response regulator protein-glutamate methylesterase [Dorea sp.]MCI9247739.1 chemotaxis response regulator protein-glutamate methylesterase [Dorea sp.]
MTNKKIRVLIVDDSLVFVNFLSHELPKADNRIEIVGYAMNAADAMRKIPTTKPDVLTLDVEMPKMNGIDFLEELLPRHLLPVILVSSLNVGVFDALANGAVDFVKKPDMSRNYSSRTFVQNLAGKINIASNATVKLPRVFRGSSVIKKGASFAGQPGSAGSDGASKVGTPSRPVTAPAAGNTLNSGQSPTIRKPVLAPMTAAVPRLTNRSLKLDNLIIALGASTGGTEATLQVLEQLPADIPGMVITQHMPEGFTQMYAQRLDRLCKMEVKEASDGDQIKRGRVLIAPGGDKHMKIVRVGANYAVRIFPADKVNGHRPSVDVLFKSVAQTAVGGAVGIILTGMGQDGAYGLLDMKKAGAYTIGQDKESCIVYGMPMVAQNIGAVTVQASCANIPGILIKYLNML